MFRKKRIPFLWVKPNIKREGTDVTVVATGTMVNTALSAAEKMAEEGISVEVVDPRTLSPLDEGHHYRFGGKNQPFGDYTRRG